MPGEFLQIDWGEVCDMPFTKAGMEGQTRYFFAARLKYRRYNGYPAPSTHATLTHALEKIEKKLTAEGPRRLL